MVLESQTLPELPGNNPPGNSHTHKTEPKPKIRWIPARPSSNDHMQALACDDASTFMPSARLFEIQWIEVRLRIQTSTMALRFTPGVGTRPGLSDLISDSSLIWSAMCTSTTK